MKHVVAFSTGVGSAEVAYRLVERHGPSQVVLLSADTRREDADNWRFAQDVWRQLEVEWHVVSDGRTPLEVGRANRVVPNNRLPLCSRELKVKQMRQWLEAHYEPDEAVLALGLDWTEQQRIEGRWIRGEYFAGTRERWLPWATEYPLCDEPLLLKHQLLEGSRARGVEPPRLYATGAPHANCGGACVRAGQHEWERLLRWNRERYLSWEAEEDASRELLGDVAILRDRTGGTTSPMSLRTFRQRLEHDPTLFDPGDEGTCACI